MTTREFHHRAWGARAAQCAVILAFGMPWIAHGQTVNLDRLLNANATNATPPINQVRKAALDGAAITIGTQTGMIERANEIGRIIARRADELDQTFRFGDLVIGQGVLPPVIVETQNAVSVNDNSMRLAGAVYRLDQPARFFAGAPSWRDWLLLGLPVGQELPEIPQNEQLLPKDEKERQYWRHQVKLAYENGRAQADEIFRNNMGQLVKTYNGMRTFYDLYERKMVSAPYIASAQEVVTQDDPNMMVVGDTTFRITLPSQLNTDAKQWKPLQATPRAPSRLPVVKSTALEQARRKKEEATRAAAQQQDVQTAPVRETAPVKAEPAPKVEKTNTESTAAPSGASSDVSVAADVSGQSSGAVSASTPSASSEPVASKESLAPGPAQTPPVYNPPPLF